MKQLILRANSYFQSPNCSIGPAWAILYCINSTIVWLGWIWPGTDSGFYIFNVFLAGIVGLMWIGTFFFPYVVAQAAWELLVLWAQKDQK